MSITALVHDVETETNPWYGHLASPYNPLNYVVMDAFEQVTFGGGAVSVSPRTEQRFASVEDFKARWPQPFPDNVAIYVAHNAAYEMQWQLEHNFDNFVAFLKRGGRVYCTAYAHYLLSNQQDTYPPLNEVAPLYGGTQKVDGVKALWDAGVLTSAIDPELLSEYLSGPNGDIDNTTRVFLGTWNKLVERNMLTMALVRMDSLLYLAFCMHFGLKVDEEKAHRLQAENEAALADLNKQLYEYLPDDMPEEAREQFKGTRFQLSAFLFGGAMKYESQVPRTDSTTGELIYKKADGPVFKDGKETYVLRPEWCEFDEEAGGLWYDPRRKVHQVRYTAGKNKGQPKFGRYVTDEVDTKKGELIYQFQGMIQGAVRAKLQDAIDTEWAGSQKLADGTPVISTAGDVLEVLAAHDVPVAKLLDLIGKIEKDLGAFYLVQTFNKDGSLKKQSGMLQYVQADGFIHHTLNTTSTVTARLSSNKPNMQQIPRAEEAKPGDFKSKVKSIFISRFGADGGILQEDYSALETVGQQVMTGDQNLKEALIKGLDMHSMRLAAMEELTYEYVVARTKDGAHPEHAEWDVKRTGIKPVAFQYQYGATAYGMAMSTGKSQEFCQAFIDAEKKAFPGVEAWYDNVVYPSVEESALKRKPTRVQTEDGQYRLYRTGVFIAPSGTTYQFQQYTKLRWDPESRTRKEFSEFKVPQMRNYPIQGESGFFVQLGCGMLIRHFIARDFYGMKALPINTVHDANYFDVHKDVVKQVACEVEVIMESIPEMLNHLWPAYNVEVPFPVAGGYGDSMAEENPVFSDKSKKEDPDGFKADKAAWVARKNQFKTDYLAAKNIQVQFPCTQ